MELAAKQTIKHSAIYQCQIKHKRLIPIKRAFAYRAFMLSIDLDELKLLDKLLFGFSYNKRNIYSIFDTDYLSNSTDDSGQESSIKLKIYEYLLSKGVTLPDNPRYLLQTFPRIFGYQFNPVSFYYINNELDETQLIVAEVGNTYLEKKLYIIHDKDEKTGWFSLKTAKDFYVSPFSKVDDDFYFKLGPLATASCITNDASLGNHPQWAVNINNENDNGVVLTSSIRGQRQSLVSYRLMWYLLVYPFMTIGVITSIHWHALIMWLRQLPVTNKASSTQQQKEVLRPHKSID